MSESMWDAAEEYDRARRRLNEARQALLNANAALSDAAVALAVRVAPKDARIGEVITVWVRLGRTDQERLLCVRRDDERTWAVWYRGEPVPPRSVIPANLSKMLGSPACPSASAT